MNKIFSYFVIREDDPSEVKELRQKYLAFFVTNYPLSVFSHEDVVMSYYCKLAFETNVTLSVSNLQALFNLDLKKVIMEHKVKVLGTEELSLTEPSQLSTIVEITRNTVAQQLTAAVEENQGKDIPLALVEFHKTAKSEAYFRALTEGDIIANSEKLHTKLHGIDDAVTKTLSTLSEVQNTFSEDKLRVIGAVERIEHGYHRITTWGLPTVDSDSGGLYTSRLYGIEGGPGVGKTRLAVGTVVYNTLVVSKKNVYYIALEQSELEIKALLTSRHIFEMTNGTVQINDGQILDRTLLTAELLPYVAAAEQDLYKSGKFGEITFHIGTGRLYAEELYSTLLSAFSINPGIRLYVLDHMYLLASNAFSSNKMATAISEGYKEFKRFVRDFNIAGLAINQLNREGIEASDGGKEITSTMAAGGIDVYRNTDYNLAISQSKVMEKQRMMFLNIPKKRGTKGFGVLRLRTSLQVCYAVENKESVV